MSEDAKQTMNQTVIVTGASRGLGAAVARIVGEMGARVVVTARSEDKLAEVVTAIQAAGGAAIAVPGDISDPVVVRAVVDAAITHFGQLDAIVNNAGVLEPITRIAETDAHDWQHNWTINVLAPVMLTQAALPHLRAQKGRVINISSGAAVSAKIGWGAYCTTKAALNMFNSTLALEEPVITALAVRPGMVDTEMQALIRREGDSAMTEQDHAFFVGHHQQGEIPAPAIPGRAIAILALYAPPEWSGEFIRWDDERVETLIS
ncbi:MAG: SDR family NAD(P)-dependent oxidoreductase [Anaerolineae bacterium]|nr:SDR family NAD(P)-dependent oxidoreductase [Anaerolineae bacterium]